MVSTPCTILLLSLGFEAHFYSIYQSQNYNIMENAKCNIIGEFG